MTKNNLGNIEILFKDFAVGVQVKFEYKMVSPVNIVRAHVGPLNLEEKSIIQGQRHSNLLMPVYNRFFSQ